MKIYKIIEDIGKIQVSFLERKFTHHFGMDLKSEGMLEIKSADFVSLFCLGEQGRYALIVLFFLHTHARRTRAQTLPLPRVYAVLAKRPLCLYRSHTSRTFCTESSSPSIFDKSAWIKRTVKEFSPAYSQTSSKFEKHSTKNQWNQTGLLFSRIWKDYFSFV